MSDLPPILCPSCEHDIDSRTEHIMTHYFDELSAALRAARKEADR